MTDKEIDQLVTLLKKLEPGFLPYKIFEQVARLTALSIIEFVPLRRSKAGEVEVLLLEREKDDPIWPGALHTPGTVIRPRDNQGDMYKAFDRIVKEELKNTDLSTPYFIGSLLHNSKRGTEHAQIYWVEVLGDPKTGKFYPAIDLPVDLIESQQKFIALAVDSFKKFNS